LIEVNLLPGGKKRRTRSFSFSLPKFGGGGGGGPDPYIMGCVVAGLIAVGYMAWAYMGIGSTRSELQVQLDEATQDSVRFADLIKRTNELTVRRDSIAQRVAIIQEIDAGRYVWPHIFNEIARAVPDYTWLISLVQVGDDPIQLRLNGRAGSNPAITAFMRNLEASRFLRTVRIERTQQVVSEDNPADLVYDFDLEFTYEPPGLDELETVPLFTSGLADQVATPDSVGG
jgi:type IV pilus assembly protein PilN